MSEIQYSVEVKDVEKHFKVYMDKGSTLKERAIFHNRNRHENRQILDGISFEIHHVNKMKNLKGKEQWEMAMIARKRKTLVVCKECHKKIHYSS